MNRAVGYGWVGSGLFCDLGDAGEARLTDVMDWYRIRIDEIHERFPRETAVDYAVRGTEHMFADLCQRRGDEYIGEILCTDHNEPNGRELSLVYLPGWRRRGDRIDYYTEAGTRELLTTWRQEVRYIYPHSKAVRDDDEVVDIARVENLYDGVAPIPGFRPLVPGFVAGVLVWLEKHGIVESAERAVDDARPYVATWWS